MRDNQKEPLASVKPPEVNCKVGKDSSGVGTFLDLKVVGKDDLKFGKVIVSVSELEIGN